MGSGFGSVSVMRRGSSVTVRNSDLQVSYDLLTGLWSYADSSGFELIRGVCAKWRQTDGKVRATSDACLRSFHAAEATSDRFGDGAEVVFSHAVQGDSLRTEVVLNVYSDLPFAIVSVRVCSEGDRPVSVDRLAIVEVPRADGKPVGGLYLGSEPPECLVYLNGSGHVARGFQTIRDGVVYPDSLSTEYISDGIVLHPRTQRSIAFGFLAAERWWSGATVGYESTSEEDRSQHGIGTWSVFQTCDGAVCEPGSELSSEPLYINVSTPAAEAQRHYAAVVSDRLGEPITEPPAVTNTVRVGEGSPPAAERVHSVLTWLGRHGGAFVIGDGGLRHLRLMGDWSAGGQKELTRNFPDGVRPVVEAAHGQGLGIGADLHTFLIDGEVEPAFKPAVLQLRNSQPATFSSGASTNCVALDPTHPLTRDYLRKRLSVVYRDWGFDTLHTSLFPFRDLAADDVSRFRWHGRSLTRMQILRAACELLLDVKDEVAPAGRLGLADMPQGVILGGSHHSSAGLDLYYEGRAALWEGQWGLREFLRAYAAKWYTQGYWWDMELGPLRFIEGRPRNESQLLMTLGILSGGHLSFADDLATLEADESDLLAKCFPLMGMMARPVPLQEGVHTYGWTQSVEASFGSWEVLALLNLSDVFEDVDVQFSDLNLNKSKNYLAYEFWDGQFFGSYQRTFSVQALPPRSAKLFVLREETEAPCLLATDFHVSQGKVELQTLGWDERSETLLGVCQALKKGRGTLSFHVPENRVPVSVAAAGSKYSYEWRPPVYELHLAFSGQPVPFSIRFARSSG
ncbi:hypothetical protein FJZ36_05865 [Candidatus Poribacteria bacterium]|nr:hypothetical protein [Candidatus Poribacteria bacterium]